LFALLNKRCVSANLLNNRLEEEMIGAGVKRPLPDSSSNQQHVRNAPKRQSAPTSLPPLPLRQPQPQPFDTNATEATHHHTNDDFVPAEIETLQDAQDWDFIMQHMAEEDSRGLQYASLEDEIVPSCPIVVSEESFAEQAGAESEVPSLGADISESAWIAEEEVETKDEDEDGGDQDAEDAEGLWGLPPVVGEILGQRGITQLYGPLFFYYLLK
jgi:hypothetical protein